MRPLNVRDVDGTLVVVLDDLASVNDGQSDQFRKALYERVGEISSPRIAVDLTGIDFLSSSGVALLIGLRRRLVAVHGQLVLFNLQPYIRDLLEMMKLAPLFQIVETEASALAAFPPS